MNDFTIVLTDDDRKTYLVHAHDTHPDAAVSDLREVLDQHIWRGYTMRIVAVLAGRCSDPRANGVRAMTVAGFVAAHGYPAQDNKKSA